MNLPNRNASGDLLLEPEPLALAATDGYPLKGFVWRHTGGGAQGDTAPRPVVVINAATSVRCRYYFRFASYLYQHGLDVLVYDYRGIGESRPARMAGFDASWLDWGERDCEAALRHAHTAFPGQPLYVVGHSVGGLALGLAPSNHLVRRALTVGAQYAYWPDYASRVRYRMWLKWHLLMPVIVAICGYVPAKRLGWMEDTPRGVALSWSRSRANFEDTYQRAPIARSAVQRQELVRRFAGLRAPLLAVSATDDPYGTVAATERLLRYHPDSAVTHLRIAPDEIGARQIGHFAFFHNRFEPTLWPLALHWLRHGQIAPAAPGHIVSQRGGGRAEQDSG